MSIDDKQQPSSKDSSDWDILCEIEKFSDLAYYCDSEKDYQGAINNYIKAIDLDSERGDLYKCRAESKEKLEDYLGVIEDTTKAIDLHKEECFYLKSELYFIRSNAKKKLGDNKGYLEDLAKEKESKTNEDAQRFKYLADSFFENKDYKSAIENYTKAIDINTNDPLLYLYRGQSKFELKDYLGALSDYSKAIELEPEDDFIYESIGYVYSEMKDYKKAIQAFTTCIEKNFCPSFYLYVHRASAKRGLKDYEGEIEDLTNAIKSLDEDEYILKTGLFEKRGKAREKLGDIKGSIDDFKKEKEISEKRTNESFSELIEEFQECQGKEYKDIDAYKKVFKKAQSLLKDSTTLSDKQRIELHIMKGNIQDDVRENFDGAINEYKKALKIDSEDWTIWYNLGVSYGRKGEADLAISIYKKVIKLNPESGASYYNRAVQYLTKNEFDKACEDFHCAQRLGIDSSIPIKKFCIPKEQDDIGKYIEQHTIDPEEINPEDFIR